MSKTITPVPPDDPLMKAVLGILNYIDSADHNWREEFVRRSETLRSAAYHAQNAVGNIESNPFAERMNSLLEDIGVCRRKISLAVAELTCRIEDADDIAAVADRKDEDTVPHEQVVRSIDHANPGDLVRIGNCLPAQQVVRAGRGWVTVTPEASLWIGPDRYEVVCRKEDIEEV